MSKQVEKELSRMEAAERDKVKLLLLGAGESGKSTIFRQMKILYGKPFSPEEEGKSIAPVVQNNVLCFLKSLCDQLRRRGRVDELSSETRAAFTTIDAMEDDSMLSTQHYAPFQTFWSDAIVQEVWNRRSDFHIIESTAKFLEEQNLSRLCSDSYVASQEDLLLTRIRTSGIVEEEFVIDGVAFAIYDVGGQRNERKKWIHCFDCVTAVIFVAGLSEYDQKLYEDTSTNRMMEALELFKEVVNNQYFLESSMIIFLNKLDLFIPKLQRIDIKETFEPLYLEKYPDGQAFNGDPGNHEHGFLYFKDLFLSQCRVPNKTIYCHATCATDTENVKVVFEASKETILHANLANSGFAL